MGEIYGALVRVYDAAAPTLVDSVVAGTSLVLYYGETLDPGSEPATSAFAVTVAGSAATVSDVSMSDDAVTVAYTAPTSNPVQDVAGNDAASLPAMSVTNAGPTDPGKPTLVTPTDGDLSSDPLVLTIAFNRSLDPARVPDADAFSLSDPTLRVIDVAVRGKKVELIVGPGIFPCASFTVSYAKPTSNALRSVWGTEIDSFADQTAAISGASQCAAARVRATAEPSSVSLKFDRSLDRCRAPSVDSFAVTATSPDGVPTPAEICGIEFPADATQLQVLLCERLAEGAGAEVSYSRSARDIGLWDDSGNQIAPFSAGVDEAENRAPTFGGVSGRSIHAVPGILVSIPLDKADFVDPDGDKLTFEMTASRDDIYAAGDGLGDGLIYSEWSGRVFFLAKTTCSLARLNPAPGEVYETVVTITATDPDGESVQASVVFRTDPVLTWNSQPLAGGPCPSFSGASVDGSTLVVSLDGAVANSYNRPGPADFAVTVDGAAVGVAGVDERSRHAAIILTLAAPVAHGQSVTVTCVSGHSQVAQAFTDQPVANNTPKPPTPVCLTAPEGATAPICAAVSGKDLIVTFSGDLAAIDGPTADALRFAIFVDGAFHNGASVNSQSAARIAVDGATLTLTLGTAVRAGDEVTIRYFASASGGGLNASDGTPLADFTLTLTVTTTSG